eukprot:jgi/Mesvir1/17207/Mv07624-RA.1
MYSEPEILVSTTVAAERALEFVVKTAHQPSGPPIAALSNPELFRLEPSMAARMLSAVFVRVFDDALLRIRKGDVADTLLEEAIRFLILKRLAPGKALLPSCIVDQVWMCLMDFHAEYAELCSILLFPAQSVIFTRDPACDDGNLTDKAAYRRTLAYYKQVFKCKPPKKIWPVPSSILATKRQDTVRVPASIRHAHLDFSLEPSVVAGMLSDWFKHFESALHYYGGLGVTDSRCRLMEVICFLMLKSSASNKLLLPSPAVDDTWQFLMQSPAEYAELCSILLYPAQSVIITRDPACDDATLADMGYKRTLAYYKRVFGCEPPEKYWPVPPATD